MNDQDPKLTIDKKLFSMDLNYEKAKALMTHEDPQVRYTLAKHPQTPAEILYFLSEDKNLEVREAIAENKNTPRQADLILANDQDPRVRHQLVHKINRILPDLNNCEKDILIQITEDILTKLAQDEVEHIRVILSKAVKSLPNIPRDVICHLANDQSFIVAEPVLHFSPILTDQDLIDIIQNDPLAQKVTAIAERKSLNSEISSQIARQGSPEAIQKLLENRSCEIDPDTFAHILQKAPDHESWHSPLIRRPNLSPKTCMRLADFVAMQLLDELQKRTDLDDSLVVLLAQAVEKRLQQEHKEQQALAQQSTENETFNDDYLVKLIQKNEFEALYQEISTLTHYSFEDVETICTSSDAKAICGFCFISGLSARLAAIIQRDVAKLPRMKIIGTNVEGQYLLNEDELKQALTNFIS